MTIVERLEFRLGDAYVGHIQDGDAAAQKGDLHAAYACYRTAVALNPRAVAVLIAAARILIAVKDGDLAEAEKMLRTAVELAPKNPTAHYWLGRCLEKTGSMVKAIESYRSTVKLAPNYADAWRHLNVVHEAVGNVPAAAIALKEYVRSEGDNLSQTAVELFRRGLGLA